MSSSYLAFTGSRYRLLGWMLLLVVSVAGIIFTFYNIKIYSLLILFFPAFFIAVYGVIWTFNQNIRKITFMFNSIGNDDYSFSFTEKLGSRQDVLLNMSLNRIKDILMEAKTEIVQNEQYYELIINSVNTGILVVNENGSVYQVNNEALRLLGMNLLTHVQQLERVDDAFPEIVKNLKTGDKQQITFTNERGTMHLSLRTSSMVGKGKNLRIIAINDINSELDEKEIESWVKLIRVLTHEIMNSVTPIISLSDTLIGISGEEQSDDIREGLEVISLTGKSLLSFVESYRKFTRIPAPKEKLFYVSEFLDKIAKLMRNEHADIDITVHVDPPGLLVFADEHLISQVMINLLKNAAQAVADVPEGCIRISAFCNSEDQVIMEVQDNGPGIAADVAEHIFVPFFTTKETGSGIGLSISRQIMRLHGGTLTFNSIAGKTRFILTFR